MSSIEQMYQQAMRDEPDVFLNEQVQKLEKLEDGILEGGFGERVARAETAAARVDDPDGRLAASLAVAAAFAAVRPSREAADLRCSTNIPAPSAQTVPVAAAL